MRPSVSKVLLILIGILCASELPILGEAAFPFYDIIHSVAPIWLRATFNGNFYYWTKMVWWGSFVIGDGGLVDNVDQGITACQSCSASHVSPNSNCREDIKELIKMSISNIIKGIVGWQTGYDPNDAAENGFFVKMGLAILAAIVLMIALIFTLNLHLSVATLSTSFQNIPAADKQCLHFDSET